MSANSSDVLKNLLILQLESVKRLVNEYHQQTEAYVQQFGYLPLSQDPAEAAHDARIVLRSQASSSPSLVEGCAVSEIIRDATKKHCGADMCVTSPEHLEHFLTIAKNDVKTAEDRVHALFVLDATLASAQRRKEMQSRFEGLHGYDLLVEWLAISCSYNDETSKAFTELLLLVLHRNVPATLFTTKTVVKNLTRKDQLVALDQTF